jgi:lactate permease
VRTLLAAAPLVAVLVLMVGLGWPAARAGLATAAGTVPLALVAFGLGGADDPFGPAAAVLGLLAEAAFIAVTVLAIVGPALAVHHLQERTGATGVLRGGLALLSPDPRVGALLVGWFFALFLEGAAGFGTPVALAAPFLVAAGLTPVAAVTAALLGHAAGVSFGALGTPVVAQTSLTDWTGAELARATSIYHVVLGWVALAGLVVVLGRGMPEHRPPWGWGALAGVCFLVPYGLLGRYVGPELPTIGAALLGAAAFVAVVRVVERGRRPALVPADWGSPPITRAPLARAAAPYLALVAIVLVTRLVPPVRDALFGVELSWQVFGQFTGSVRPLYHPGVLLPLAFAVGAVVQRVSWADLRAAVGTTNRRLAPVAVALVAMVLIARTMSQAGMTEQIALAAAGAGAAWPLLAPSVGGLGTFVTGSATASNLLFTEFQESTARAVELPVLPLLGAQGFGAAIGNVVCPHNIVAAAATVGLSGREGLVLRRTLPVAAVALTLGGVLAWFLTG